MDDIEDWLCRCVLVVPIYDPKTDFPIRAAGYATTSSVRIHERTTRIARSGQPDIR